jgi:TANFOR domain-containing protein
MRQFSKIFVWVMILWLMPFHKGYSQRYPVQATVQLLPPYSLFLSDYTAPGSEKLAVTLLMRDMGKVDYRVKLRVLIEGNNITISSKPNLVPNPIYISGGLPERLSGSLLADYFNPRNLDFQGITRADFEKTGKLPEGIYRICIQVLDYNRGMPVSNQACATAWMMLNEPPILNTPQANEKVRAMDPQNIIFNWTPLHTGSPNSAFSSEYVFRMVEIWPENRNPNDAMNVGAVFYETTTTSTSLHYGIAEPPLVPGRKYAYRVTARDTQGRDLFVNQGHSEVRMFTFGDACTLPDNLQSWSLDAQRIRVSWEPKFNHTEFEVMYREKNNPSAKWFTEKTYLQNINIISLKPATQYEVQVKGACGSIFADVTQPVLVTTNEKRESDLVCGAPPENYNMDETNLKQSLNVGDIINAGDFDIQLTLVSGSSGTFTGEGLAVVPMMNHMKVRTAFTNIKVNESNRMVAGRMRVVGGTVQMLDDHTRDKLITLVETIEENVDGAFEQANTVIDKVEEKQNEVIAAVNTVTDVAQEVQDIYNTYMPASNNTPPPTNEATGGGNGDNSGSGTGSSAVASNNESGSQGSADIETSTNNKAGNTSGGALGSGDSSTAALPGNNNNFEQQGNNHSLSNGLKFGPLQVEFVSSLGEVEPDEDGKCHYEDVIANVEFKLLDEEVSEDVRIPNTTISFTKECTTDKVVGARITYWNDEGVPIGEIYDIMAGIKGIDFSVDDQDRLEGSVTLYGELLEDKVIKKMFVIKKGMNGQFTYAFEKSDKLKGAFNLHGIKDINIDLVNHGQVIASLRNGAYNEQGVLEGDFVRNEAVTINTGSGRVDFHSILIRCRYSKKEGLSVVSGSGRADFDDIPGIDGKIKLQFTYDGYQEFLTELVPNHPKINAFGMELSNMNFQASMSQSLELNYISGSFKSKHESFNAKLNVTDFLYENGELKTFKSNGAVEYAGYSLHFSRSSYDPVEKVLSFDVTAKMQSGDDRIAVKVKSFKIHANGEIEMGELESINMDLSRKIGPLHVVLNGEVGNKGDCGRNYREYKGKCTAMMKMKNDKGKEVEQVLSEASLSFCEHKNTPGQFDNFQLTWTSPDGITFPDIQGIRVKVTKVDITMNGSQMTAAMTLAASLEEDKVILDDFILRKGVNGEIVYTLSTDLTKDNPFDGNYSLEKLKDINIDFVKNNTNIASLKNAAFNQQGSITGDLTINNKPSYQTNGFKVSLEEFMLSITTNLNTLTINHGGGKARVSEITGVEGEIEIEMEYDKFGNYKVGLVNDGATFNAYGMEVYEVGLTITMNKRLELTKIEGSGKARAGLANQSGNLEIEQFIFEQGKVTQLKAKGDLVYKKFKFELVKSEMKQEKLSFTSKVILDKVGKLQVSNFTIDANGNVSIGKIQGDIKNSVLTMKFNATFKEQGFNGSFTGKFHMVELQGGMDLGVSKTSKDIDFNYKYYRLAVDAKKGIPLGTTGLQLTKVGGMLGYNYKLTFANNTYSGSPYYNHDVMGLTLGISDVANVFALEGSSLVQIGEESVELNLLGNLSSPRTNPVISANLNVNYKMPENIIDGTVGVDVYIPNTTAYKGKVFRTNHTSTINFYYGSQKWIVNGSLSAKLLSAVNFDGSVNFQKGAQSNSVFTGTLNGRAYYSYSAGFNKQLLGLTAEGNLNLDFDSNIYVAVNEQGMSGEIGVNLNGSGSLKVGTSWANTEATVSFTVKNAKMSYYNGQGRIQGTGNISIRSVVYDKDGSISVDTTF